MCKCNPDISTPYCGGPGCEWPPSDTYIRWFENIDERWNRIGDLVDIHGTPHEKLAWLLCRGDYAELKIEKSGDIKQVIIDLKQKIIDDSKVKDV